jgi:hypothetical protein
LHRNDDRAAGGQVGRLGDGDGGGKLEGRGLRQPEVEQLDAKWRQHHVARLQVAMDDALAMRGPERVGDLGADLQHVIQGQRAPLEACRQRLAFEQFQDQIVGVLMTTDVVKRADVWVIERRDGSRLAFEALRDAPSAARASGKTFSATVRSRRVSRARYTSPILPAPRRSTTSLGPHPGARDEWHLRKVEIIHRDLPQPRGRASAPGAQRTPKESLGLAIARRARAGRIDS